MRHSIPAGTPCEAGLNRDVDADSLAWGRRLELVPAEDVKLVDWLTKVRPGATTAELVTGPVGATEADSADGAEVPAVLVAVTVKRYVAP
jgi:hypothetical protein